MVGDDQTLLMTGDSKKKFGLKDRVYFEDPVPNNKMPLWFRSASLTVVPTLEKEGTSLSAIESMACGTPTITTNVAGLADLPSYQCDPNAESMAQAIEEVLDNKEQISSEQMRKVKLDLNMVKWTDAWINVCKQVSNK